MCLSERDEVLFPHIGIRLALSRGDICIWPNAWCDQEVEGRRCILEDLRTRRIHLGNEKSEPALYLEASFHDSQFRLELKTEERRRAKEEEEQQRPPPVS
eukprot:TRINITY_DN26420_c0_g2_i1.p4 TRINITY_DN26420_c0_g2~~TRINITY_DN26420_c0_g2_i1.p4  ORF type:complete len:100 (-),score=24.77 TRINITY_DN26420_c0_g2_i1:108-407(-)